ncbi:PAS domain S-box protein [Nitrosomonas sp.]|uniref:PAS domain S-box protein n=1 Tax=Nitrosomonas sp. TaxID=42353 RepID=UPI002633BE5D|nr:PAS domain S-box protein [Nitrosomonas sp.]MCW5600686.1 PAS domain S-box protein [Nitrosomonas sp.]
MKKITQYRASSGIKHGDASAGLNESEALFRAIFDNATDGISLAEVDGRKILFGNAAFCRMLGYMPNEIKGMSVQTIHPEEELIAIMSEFMRLAGQKGGLAENIPVKRKDGHVFFADITVAYLEIGGKRYQAGFFRDVTERNQTERLLRQREADFMAIIEYSPIAKIVTGSDDKAVILMNQRFTELLGYTVEDVPNAECWWPLAYPDVQYREMIKIEWTNRVEQAMQSCGRIVPMETTVTCKDGTTRYIRFSFVSLGNKNIITCEDLTANKIMEGALRESEARYRSIFNAVDDIIFSVESDGTLSSISPSFERLTGWLPSEWIGKHFSPLVYPGDQARVQALFERLLAREAIPAFPMRLMKKEGTYLDAEIRSVAIDHGDTVAVFGILRDITERKCAEEIIFRRLAYENLLSRISSMALTADNLHEFLEQSIAVMGETMAVSRSYLFEHCHETDTMDNTYEWCAPGIAPHKENNQEVSSNLVPWWVSTLKSSQNICFANIDEIPDEGVKEILRRQDIRSILVVPLFVSGHYYGFLGFDECLQHRVWPQEDVNVFLSISRIISVVIERKRVEEEIYRLNQSLEAEVMKRTKALLEAQEELVRKEKLSMLGQVAGSVGHELRNPLGVMSNAVYFLQMVLSDADETVLEYLEIIKNEITAADRIVGDLLDSVRTKPPQRDIVYIAPLLEQTLRKCAIPPSVTIKLDLPESLPALYVDAMQIQQVFRNLISNGIEAMPEGGALEIWAQVGKKAETMTINVRDHGIGMSQEQLGRLFQPLFTTKARGIGLGLVVVRNLIQANEGCVQVKSEWGVGSTFAVTLPVYHAIAG